MSILPQLEREIEAAAERRLAMRRAPARSRRRTLALALMYVILGVSVTKSLVSIAPAPSRLPRASASAEPRPAGTAPAGPALRAVFVRDIALTEPLNGCLSAGLGTVRPC